MKNEFVYVVDKHGKPLMPTKNHCKVRHLLDEKRAVAIGNNPLVIRLKYEVSGYTQPVHEGIDTGRENIGDAASLEDGTNVYLADVKTDNKSIKKKMQDRAGFRRERRHHDRQSKQRKAVHDGTEIQNGDDDTVRTKHDCKSRKVTYPGAENPVTHKVIQGKEGKFNNRKRPEKWITPSARQVVQITMTEIKQTAKILPVSHICLERVSFDFQKLENENIKRWEYGKGPLYGYHSYKDYINDEQHGKCLLCGKNRIEYYHHIEQVKDGRYDSVKNIAGLCEACHYGPYGVHQDAETEALLKELKEGARQKYQVGLLNSVMQKLIEEVSAYCEAKGIEFTVTDGKTTADTRKKYGLQKYHCVDAYAISLTGRNVDKGNVVLADKIYRKRRFKKKSKNIVAARNQRVYELDGKVVAYNRHKATDQKEDSLEQFMAAYAATHTEKECRQLMHKLVIKPAKRTYTYRKDNLVAPIRPGDLVEYRKYNKVKGNTKTLVFPAVSVEYTEVVRSGNGHKWSEREWKVGIDDSKVRKAKFCRYLSGGCLQTVDVQDTGAYLQKVAAEDAKRKAKLEAAKAEKKLSRTAKKTAA